MLRRQRAGRIGKLIIRRRYVPWVYYIVAFYMTWFCAYSILPVIPFSAQAKILLPHWMNYVGLFGIIIAISLISWLFIQGSTGIIRNKQIKQRYQRIKQ